MIFAQPGWLAFLLLLPFVGFGAVLFARLRSRQWSVFVAPRLRDNLMKRGPWLPRWLALSFLLVASAAIIIALARPRADAGTKTEKTLGRNVLIALDISRSMRVQDVKPDRLSQAKIVIYELLEAMPNERIGFLAFAGDPYLYAPLTIDHAAVRETVEQIDETWAPLGGSDLSEAVQLAVDTLKKTGQKNNTLVVLSDGEEIRDRGDRSKLAEATANAERAGVYVVAIGVGTDDGDHVPNKDFPGGKMVDRSGQLVVSRLQADSLRSLAEGTKGRFAIAGSGLDLAGLVKSVVKDMDAFEMDGRERKVSIEFYQWLIFPAILFLMVSIVAGTRWRGIRTVAVAALIILTTRPVEAGPATAAKDAMAGKQYESARDAYRDLANKSRSPEERARYRLAEGTAAYRAGAFRDARSSYSGSLLSGEPAIRMQGHLGMGNCLFQLGWLGLSGKRYPADPAALPDLDHFDAIVKEQLAKMMGEEVAEDSDSGGYVKFESLITNWVDAVRHYDFALKTTPASAVAQQNRALTMTYLKRLEELLRQEEQQTRESMPQIVPGEGPGPKGEKGPPNDGKNGDEGDEGEGDEKKGDKGKDGKEKDKDGKGGDEKKDDKQGDKGKDKDGNNPNESPEDRARRILKENADTEKGPLTPGRRELRNPEKDW